MASCGLSVSGNEPASPYLAAEGACVSSVLAVLNLLHLLTQGGTIASTVLANNSDLLGVTSHCYQAVRNEQEEAKVRSRSALLHMTSIPFIQPLRHSPARRDREKAASSRALRHHSMQSKEEHQGPAEHTIPNH